ncbi:MAG: DoxX subfamily [Luteitalea sp.]|nr:DoxX subfamily [Luteitalea sp.]
MHESGSTAVARVALVTLRTLIGWHFLYEGYYKLILPAWTSGGAPAGRWSAAGYLANASGPLADPFRALAQSSMLPWIDTAVMIALVLVGLSLLLGLFTQVGCAAAMLLLATFYVALIPVSGAPAAGSEGTYLLVNKTLVELVAVWVLLTFRTGRIAGLDVLLRARRAKNIGEPSRPSEMHALAGR